MRAGDWGPGERLCGRGTEGLTSRARASTRHSTWGCAVHHQLQVAHCIICSGRLLKHIYIAVRAPKGMFNAPKHPDTSPLTPTTCNMPLLLSQVEEPFGILALEVRQPCRFTHVCYGTIAVHIHAASAGMVLQDTCMAVITGPSRWHASLPLHSNISCQTEEQRGCGRRNCTLTNARVMHLGATKSVPSHMVCARALTTLRFLPRSNFATTSQRTSSRPRVQQPPCMQWRTATPTSTQSCRQPWEHPRPRTPPASAATAASRLVPAQAASQAAALPRRLLCRGGLLQQLR